MHSFTSLTPQGLLTEVAEYIRMRALQVGIEAHPTFKRVPKARREYVRAQEDALRLVAQEIESAGAMTTPLGDSPRTAGEFHTTGNVYSGPLGGA